MKTDEISPSENLKPFEVTDKKEFPIFEIPSVVSGEKTSDVVGDSCAKMSFIKESYARRLCLTIQQDDISKVCIGNGRTVLTLGSAEARFRFQNDAGVYMPTFHLLPTLILDVILGRPFLKATRIFSSTFNRARRVVQRFISKASHQFLYLGDSAPRFTGCLNNCDQEALADSGARVLIMDSKDGGNGGHEPLF